MKEPVVMLLGTVVECSQESERRDEMRRSGSSKHFILALDTSWSLSIAPCCLDFPNRPENS